MSTGQRQLIVVKKEMGITHNDFYAELPALLGDVPCRQNGEAIACQFDGKRIEIMLGAEEVRQLGRSVRLPVTVVTLRFLGFSAQEINDFIRHFNLRFMKGGG